MCAYQNIFTPLTINGMTLRNRIIMPPMGTNFAGLNGEVSQEQFNYYELRAKGGTGLITIENACIDFPFASNGTTQLRIDNDQYVPGLFKLTEKVHKHGACVALQLNHAGASAYPARLNGQPPISSSNVPSKKNGLIPRSMSVEEIYGVVDKFGEAAVRARKAGFDAVEIHAGHSYLLCQFLSPLYNQRTDDFGGSIANRARFVKLVMEKVRQQVGPRYPVSLRFGAEEFLEGGNHLEDMFELLEYFQHYADILNVSAALNDNIQYQIDQMDLADGWKRYLSRAIRDKFGKPTVIAGNIRNPAVAEDILASGDADLIAIGRGLIAEPEWANKVERGDEHLLRKCISCNIGCADHRIASSKPIRCTINPDIFYGDAYKQKQVKRPTHVVVIGGGTAGMEAACTAAEVGCTTWLFEERDHLGGLATEIAKLPEKRRIADFPRFMKHRLTSLDRVMLHIGTRANIDNVSVLKPDLIINATGSQPLLPPINGLMEHIDQPEGNLFSITRFLGNLEQFSDFENKHIVVIGGGAVGLDVTEFFAKRGSTVSLVEMQSEAGKDLDYITKTSMVTMLEEYNVTQHLNTQLMEVAEDHFIVKNNNEIATLPFDYGFVCLGMRADKSSLPEFTAWGKEHEVPVLNIGDSVVARRIIDGVREGRNIINKLEDMGILA